MVHIIAPDKPKNLWLPGRLGATHASGELTWEFEETTDAQRAGFSSRVVQCAVVRCCHCACRFLVVQGSGTRRGYCTRHMGPTCGKPECEPEHCRNWDAKQRLRDRE